MKLFSRTRTMMAAAALFTLQQASAVSIAWGNSTLFSETSNTSDNTVFTDGDANFALGIFGNGFVPTAGNINDWSANFVIFDQAPIVGNAFGGSADLNDNTVFPAGEQFYILGINGSFGASGDVIPASITEAFLGTASNSAMGIGSNNFLVPDAATAPNGLQTNFFVEGEFFAPVVGSVNTDAAGDPTGGVTFAAIPEPSSAMLLLVSFACGLSLRRRS